MVSLEDRIQVTEGLMKCCASVDPIDRAILENQIVIMQTMVALFEKGYEEE